MSQLCLARQEIDCSLPVITAEQQRGEATPHLLPFKKQRKTIQLTIQLTIVGTISKLELLQKARHTTVDATSCSARALFCVLGCKDECIPALKTSTLPLHVSYRMHFERTVDKTFPQSRHVLAAATARSCEERL